MISHALVRPPADSFVRAISTTREPIDAVHARAQHREYCQALAEAGLHVEAMPPDERFPDSCFMQDPAVVIDGLAVIGRLAPPTRRGEEEEIANLLAARFAATRIRAPGTLEGGDVLILPDRVLVGRSARTNHAGIAQLGASLTEHHGQLGTEGSRPLPVLEVDVGNCLHLLSAVTCLGDRTLLVAESFAAHPRLTAFSRLVVPESEAYACNALAIGSAVVLPAGYPKTAALLHANGFTVLPVPTSEFAKADGGVTCLSLAW